MQGRSRRALLVGIALVGILGIGAGTQALVSGNDLSRVTFTLRQDAEGGEPAKEEHEKQQQRQLDSQIHGDANGKLRPDLYRKALADWDRVVIDASRTLPKQRGPKSVGSAAQTAAGGGVVGVQWTQIGPAPLAIDAEQNYQGDGPDAGQVPDLAIDPRNTADQVIYAAFNDGGLWKTTDGGDTWKPLTDYMPSLSTGAVELDPANPSIVYVGTGNIYNNGYFKGIGVYRSADAGATWAQVAGNATLTAISGSRGIHDIKMPAANTLLVATNKGLFRSTDSGATFTQITVGGTTNAFISDIDLDTQNPATTVYAAVSGVGVFVSTDGGLTFPAASNLFTGANGGPVGFARPAGSNFAYLSFAQSDAPDNGQTMYVNAQRTGDPSTPAKRFDGFWRSTDGGANWTDISAAANAGGQLNGCQCGYDQTIGVDPVDATQVYAGYQELWYSSNSGGSFANISDGDIHWDHHELLFSPPNHRSVGDTTTRAWIGTDGGVTYTDDAGANFTHRNGAIATNLFRAMDIGHGAGNNAFSVGGAQDTGTMRHKASDGGTVWHEAVDADGGPTAVDWQDPDNAFGISNGQFIRTTNGGDSWIRAGSDDIDCVNMTAGAAVDPNDGDNVYVPAVNGTTPTSPCSDDQGTGIYRSKDGGANFLGADFVATPAGARVTYIATTPTDSNLMWVGLNNGQVAVSTDINATTPSFTAKTVTGAPGSNPIGIAIDPNNTDHVVVVFPGFNSIALPTRTKHVFATTDGGTSWTDIGGTALVANQMVPDLPITSVVIDPQTAPASIIVASDLGVLRTSDNGATWQRLGIGLPNVNVTSLSIDFTVTPSILRAATYGRSAFELTTATGPLLGVNCELGFGVVDLNTQATKECELFNVGSTDLHVNSFTRSGGSTDFSILSGPATPVTIQPGEHVDWTIAFKPTTVGDLTATFQIASDDPFEPTKTLNASGTGVSGQIAVSGDLNFGTVPRGQTASRNLIVQNIGAGTLKLTSVSLLAGDPWFSIIGGPASPPTVNIPPGAQVTYTVQFAPPANATAAGNPHTRTFRIVSNAPSSPTDVIATADVGVPAFSLSTSSLAYGGIPVDNRTTPHDKTLTTTLSNQSSCPLCDLTVTGLAIIGADAGNFTIVGAPSLPYTVAAGNSLDLSVVFNPLSAGAKAATLRITTDDPANPVLDVTLTGTGLIPAISFSPLTLIFGPTVISPMCASLCGTTLPETFTNTGEAELIVDSVTFPTGSPPFSGPPATSPPTRVQVGSSFTEPVTFTPSAAATKVTGTLRVADEFVLDPDQVDVAATVNLCGEAVGRGIRVLVVDRNGVPVPSITSLMLKATGVAAPPNVNLKDLPLVTIDPPASCQTIQQHYENQNLSTTDQSAPRGSYYTLTVAVKNKKATLTFGLKVNEFKLVIVTVG